LNCLQHKRSFPLPVFSSGGSFELPATQEKLSITCFLVVTLQWFVSLSHLTTIIKRVVLWVVTSCSVAGKYRRFEGIYNALFSGMKGAGSRTCLNICAICKESHFEGIKNRDRSEPMHKTDLYKGYNGLSLQVGN
jgi:hypothetical protein